MMGCCDSCFQNKDGEPTERDPLLSDGNRTVVNSQPILAENHHQVSHVQLWYHWQAEIKCFEVHGNFRVYVTEMIVVKPWSYLNSQ